MGNLPDQSKYGCYGPGLGLGLRLRPTGLGLGLGLGLSGLDYITGYT